MSLASIRHQLRPLLKHTLVLKLSQGWFFASSGKGPNPTYSVVCIVTVTTFCNCYTYVITYVSTMCLLHTKRAEAESSSRSPIPWLMPLLGTQ